MPEPNVPHNPTAPQGPLVIDDEDRYSRLRLIGWWDQRRLAAAKILVVGAGALGNEVLKNLALVGIGQVYLVDFDRIELSNLARSVLFRAEDRGRLKAEVAAEAVRRLNPDLRVLSLPVNVITEVGLGLFRDVDVVIGCLDNREARLWVNRCCWKVGTPWIDGGIQEINGVTKVFIPPDSACYECGMTETDYRLINLRYSCPLLPREEMLAGKVPTAPTIASFVGALQAQEALKLLHDLPTLSGEAMIFNGLSNQFYTTRFQRREDCMSHETYPEPLELPLSHQSAAQELFEAVSERLGERGAWQLILDRDLAVSLDCGACGRSEPAMKPLQGLKAVNPKCPDCGEMIRPRLEHKIEQDDILAGEKLATLGVPAYDIVRLASPTAEAFVLLGGDRF